MAKFPNRNKYIFDLRDKVALITGGRRGMGKAHALALSSRGAHVVITDVDVKDCQFVVDEIKSLGNKAACFKMDVANKKEVDIVFDEVIKKFSRLDVLVNNAGVFLPKPALEITEEEWEKTIHIDLRGVFLCAQRAAKEMAKNKWGRIINISSIASGGVGVGFMGAAHYTAAKGGVIGLTETLAVEWASLGINVNAVAPGVIDTPMIEESKMSKEATEALLQSIPLKRMGRSEEVAAMIVFLASEEASYITGATFYVDGGWLAT